MPVGELEPNQFRAFSGQKEGPTKIIGMGMDVAENCGLDCPHCYRRDGVKQIGHMPFETASGIMSGLKSAGVPELYLLGAEPTTNPNLPRIIQEAAALQFKFTLLISHGLRFSDEDYARRILQPGVSLLMHRHTLEIDASAQRIQEANVGRSGTLARSHQAWKNVQKIFKEKGGEDKLMMQCCLTDSVMSDGNLDRLFRWSREQLSALPIMEYVSPTHTSHKGQLKWFLSYPTLENKIASQMERFMKTDQDLGMDVSYRDAVSPQAYNSSCTMLREGGQIANDGTVMPCTNMGRRSTNPVIFGNILRDGFQAIEQNPIRQAFLKPNFRLQGCDNPCQGSGCWWTGLVTTGCYRLCQLNCVFNEGKKTIDDMQDLCNNCTLDSLRQEGAIKCGPGTRPGLALEEEEKAIFKI